MRDIIGVVCGRRRGNFIIYGGGCGGSRGGSRGGSCGGSRGGCYGLYKQDLTSTKRRLVLVKNQCAGHGTDGTSEAMGRGVAELHN